MYSTCHPARNYNSFGKTLPALFNVLFDEFPSAMTQKSGHANIVETPISFDIEIAFPGLQKEDFKVSLDGNTLTISGKKTTEATANDSARKYARREFAYTSFSRSFTLPEAVETSKITAQYVNGILTVTLPKSSKTEKSAQDIHIA